MSKSKSKTMAAPEKLLTETELEFMSILWSQGEGSVTDVLKQLPAGRNLAYTTVSTVMRILEQKGALKSRKEGRLHVYTPTSVRSDYEARTVKHVVKQVFNGTPMALVRQLLDSVPLAEHEIEELRKILDAARKKK